MHSNPVTWLPHSQLERYEKANIHTIVCWEIQIPKDTYVAPVNSQTSILRGLLLRYFNAVSFILSSGNGVSEIRANVKGKSSAVRAEGMQ